MKKEHIKALVLDKNEELAKLATHIGEDFDKQVIHDFRVGYKYLRSFLRLLRMHNDSKGLKLTQKTKDLYNIAGNIRDLQLELEHTSEHLPDLKAYIEDLKESLTRNKKLWKQTYSSNTFERFTRQIHKHKFEELPEGILANFLNSKMTSIDGYASLPDPSDNQVHTVRKEAKDIIYASQVVHNNWDAAKRNLRIVPVKDLTRLAEKIGDYNDDRQHVERMTLFSTQKAGTDDKKAINEAAAAGAPRLAKEKNTILALLKKLLQKTGGGDESTA